jgi:hypothetical protein
LTGSHAASRYSLFAVTNETAIDELRTLDIAALSAEESKQLFAMITDKIV